VAVTVGCVTEEEKIQEYLNRSDTAVIYPEPVSDHEGDEEEEDEDEANKNDGKTWITVYSTWVYS